VWAERIDSWRRGAEPAGAQRASVEAPASRASRDVYCYFDNTDDKLRAPADAQALARMLGVGPALGRRAEGRGGRVEHSLDSVR
jgi:uncharacterized protein YecE (DUF72 family)